MISRPLIVVRQKRNQTKAHRTWKTAGNTIEPQQTSLQRTPRVTEILLNTPPLEKKKDQKKDKKIFIRKVFSQTTPSLGYTWLNFINLL